MDMIHTLTAASIFQGLVLLFLLYKIRSSKKRQDKVIDGLFDSCESILQIISLSQQVYLTEASLCKLSIRIALVKKKNCCGESYQEQVVQLLFDNNVISEANLGR